MSDTPKLKSITPTLAAAAPFWMSLAMVPLILLGAAYGGWWLLILPLYGWILVTVLDVFTGLNLDSIDPDTAESELFWYRLVTIIWFPIQFVVVFGLIWWISDATHLAGWEKAALFFGVGIMTGPVGIVYSHELLHQKNRLERWMGDLLLGMVLYSHFRSEHLLVHHIYVGTPRDPVTARYNEGFHKFFYRVLLACPKSAWKAEVKMLARRKRGAFHPSNPFWKYGALQLGALVLALILGGWTGLGLFVLQAFVAIWQLELTNYVEHYGLTREHLGDGKYEHVKPHHSWNAAHTASNWFLINLQRHSDHHYKPDRRYPLLQNYTQEDAPQLPFGYPLMTAMAMIPPLWRRRMNPRVRQWRRDHYPDITDWSAYKTASTPMPR